MKWEESTALVKKYVDHEKENGNHMFPHAYLVGRFMAMFDHILCDVVELEDIRPYLIKSFTIDKKCPECYAEIIGTICNCKESEVV